MADKVVQFLYSFRMQFNTVILLVVASKEPVHELGLWLACTIVPMRTNSLIMEQLNPPTPTPSTLFTLSVVWQPPLKNDATP